MHTDICDSTHVAELAHATAATRRTDPRPQTAPAPGPTAAAWLPLPLHPHHHALRARPTPAAPAPRRPLMWCAWDVSGSHIAHDYNSPRHDTVAHATPCRRRRAQMSERLKPQAATQQTADIRCYTSLYSPASPAV
eukprot:scaffold17875_cov112-Isochrysis_galbana.AAC.3